jgi:hypothetical protein
MNRIHLTHVFNVISIGVLIEALILVKGKAIFYVLDFVLFIILLLANGIRLISDISRVVILNLYWIEYFDIGFVSECVTQSVFFIY